MNDRFRFRSFYQGRFIYKSLTDANYYDKDNKCIGLANTLPNNLDWEQCTGKKDKNGKLIYEGDFVNITDKSSRQEPFIGVVEYTKTASFEANCNGFFMFLHDPKTKDNISDVEKIFCSSLREIEVIGNIYKTPNLLESLKNETLDKN